MLLFFFAIGAALLDNRFFDPLSLPPEGPCEGPSSPARPRVGDLGAGAVAREESAQWVLRGTLRVFSLTDIFQMLGLQRKTGVLAVEGEDDTVTISFLGGQVVAAESETRRLENRLGNLLLRAGYVTQEQLDHVLVMQKETQQRMGFSSSASGSSTRRSCARRCGSRSRASSTARSAGPTEVPVQPGGDGRLRRGPHVAGLDGHDPHGSGADGRRVAALEKKIGSLSHDLSAARRASRTFGSCTA
jgi:hypothetical protein